MVIDGRLDKLLLKIVLVNLNGDVGRIKNLKLSLSLLALEQSWTSHNLKVHFYLFFSLVASYSGLYFYPSGYLTVIIHPIQITIFSHTSMIISL